MTADRWWVKAFARWQARIDSVTQEIGLAMQSVTATGVASGALKYYGLEQFVLPFLGLTAVSLATYAYIVFEYGVKNQVSKDRQDMINNFADPDMRIKSELYTRTLTAALNGEPLSDKEREAMNEEMDCAFDELRDGIEIDT